MAYTKTNWENFPSANTPINAENLNKMEEGIANAVEKTGDTLTGELFFNNTDGYGAITKYRTVSGTNYSLALGLGANGATRLENRGGANNTCLEVRDDGLYNGNKNLKLAETAHMTWGTSFSFPLEGGHQAIIMGASSQLAIAWIAGNPPGLNFTRIAGNELNATYNGTNVTVTYGNGGSFTCSVIIV